MLSLQDENDLMDSLLKYKNSHRVRNTLVVIMTDDKIIIDPCNKKGFRGADFSKGFGEGFAEGRNDLYKEMFTKKKNYTKKLEISY